MLLENSADHLEGQSFSRRIDRENPAFSKRSLAAKVYPFARLELAAVKELHGAREKQRVILRNRAVEKRLSWPRSFDDSSLVLHNCLKDSQAFSGRDNPFRDDF